MSACPHLEVRHGQLVQLGGWLCDPPPPPRRHQARSKQKMPLSKRRPKRAAKASDHGCAIPGAFVNISSSLS